jgi:hypothetical protein
MNVTRAVATYRGALRARHAAQLVSGRGGGGDGGGGGGGVGGRIHRS